jgi:hypothetical protein
MKQSEIDCACGTVWEELKMEILSGRLRRIACAAAVLTALTANPAALAQAVYGSIVGTVTDSTGAAVPNASVVVTDVAKGTSVTVTSNGAGEFTAEHLIPDIYTVKVTAAGFKGFEQSQIQLFADTSTKVTAALQIGGADQLSITHNLSWLAGSASRVSLFISLRV